MPTFFGNTSSLIFFLVFHYLILHPAESAEKLTGLAPDNRSAWKLSLRDAISKTLENNISIAIERFESKKLEQDIVAEKSVFDPVLSSKVAAGRTKTPVSSAFASPDITQVDNQIWDIKLSQKLVTGTNYELSFNNEREETHSLFSGLDPQLSSELELTATQPLLKNFGIDINKKDIYITSNIKDISDFEFKSKVINTIKEAIDIYWDLVFSIEDLKIKEKSLNRAKDFQRKIEALVEAGKLERREILQAKSEVASREEALLVASDLIKDIQDNLKNIMDLNGSRQSPESIFPTDRLQHLPENGTQLEDHIKTALINRPDYLAKKKELKISNIELKFSENQLYPTLDLFSTLGLNGISGDANIITNSSGATGQSRFGGGYDETLRNLSSTDFYQWEVGIQLEYPLGNRFAKSRRTKAWLDEKQAILEMKDLEKDIVLEVKEVVRQVKTNAKRVKAARIALKLADDKLITEEKKFDEGVSTSFKVLQFQEDLANEESNEIGAILDYNKSKNQLQQTLATLLEENNIKLLTQADQ